MLIHVDVTAEDFASGVRHSTTHCVLALAINRHFPGHTISVVPGGVVIICEGWPSWITPKENDKGFWNVTPFSERPKDWEAEWLRIRRFRGQLAPAQVQLLNAFDKGITRSPVSFPLELTEVNHERTPAAINPTV